MWAQWFKTLGLLVDSLTEEQTHTAGCMPVIVNIYQPYETGMTYES